MVSLVSRNLLSFSRRIVNNNKISLNMCSTQTSFETLSVTQPKESVYNVELNRPKSLNAFNRTLWLELGKCFNELDTNENCRVIILSGAGKLFTAGIDFKDLMSIGSALSDQDDVARKAKILGKFIKTYQDSISSLEVCRKPVIVAIHSACIGAGVDLITAADMRYCTKDAWFQVKEVELGLAADVGSLQRLPRIIGSDSLVRELCYTARKLPADEALSCGLVSKVFENKESMMQYVTEIAEDIAKKSPVAVQGTKVNLVYSRDHSIQEGLDHMVLWNQLMLQSEDFMQAAAGQISKQPVIFSKL